MAEPQPRANNSLRVLVVDDNHINLSVISTLLKRRFAHMLDGAPVTVDSGLKAIQLLRSETFDVCLLDIQMPYLDGVECTRRIRSASDGILAENARMRIVAVTTAVGDGPAQVYRSAGFDGLIAKPVKHHHLQGYLYPIAYGLDEEKPAVPASAAEPPVVQGVDRAFYYPDGSSPDGEARDHLLTHEAHSFQDLLKAQTRASLRRVGAIASARSGTVSGRFPTQTAQKASPAAPALATPNCGTEQAAPASATAAAAEIHTLRTVGRRPSKAHNRGFSVAIDNRILNCQLQREIARQSGAETAAEPSCSTAEGPTDDGTAEEGVARPVRQRRPRPEHRISSPPWLKSTTVDLDCRSCIIDDDELPRPHVTALSTVSDGTLDAGTDGQASAASSSGSDSASDTSGQTGGSIRRASRTAEVPPSLYAQLAAPRRDSDLTDGSNESAATSASSEEPPELPGSDEATGLGATGRPLSGESAGHIRDGFFDASSVVKLRTDNASAKMDETAEMERLSAELRRMALPSAGTA